MGTISKSSDGKRVDRKDKGDLGKSLNHCGKHHLVFHGASRYDLLRSFLIKHYRYEDMIMCSTFISEKTMRLLLKIGYRPLLIDSMLKTFTLSRSSLDKALFFAKKEGHVPQIILTEDMSGTYLHAYIIKHYHLSEKIEDKTMDEGMIIEDDARLRVLSITYERYKRAFSNMRGVKVLSDDDAPHANRGMICLLNPLSDLTPRKLLNALSNEGIPLKPIKKPLHLHSDFYMYDYFPHDKNENHSEYLYENGFYFPVDSSLPVERQKKITEQIKKFIKGIG